MTCSLSSPPFHVLAAICPRTPQLSLLSNIFPRHVVEFLSTDGINAVPTQFGKLARSHENVGVGAGRSRSRPTDRAWDQ